jgi:hypothetical protein
VELVETMRSLQKEVQRYREDNERMIRAQGGEEYKLTLNMLLQRQVNKYSGTKQAASARQVATSRSHDRRDDHRGSRKSRSVSRHHHSHRTLNQKSTCTFQGQREAQVCPLSEIRGGGLSQIFCKESSGSSSHHHLMESIGREKMLKPGCWA